MHIENLSLPFSLPRVCCLNIIFILCMLIQLRITHDHKKKRVGERERKQCHIYDIYLHFELLWMRWQAHSMDNHRLEMRHDGLQRCPILFTLIERIRVRNEKKKQHSFRWNHRENERNLLASLFFFSSFFRWEKRREREREREKASHRKIKIHSMTISCLSPSFIWIKKTTVSYWFSSLTDNLLLSCQLDAHL